MSTIQLDSGPQSIGPVSGCDITSDGTNVFAFWHDEGSGQIFASSSKTNDAQNGLTFGSTYSIAKATASHKLDISSCGTSEAAISISSVCGLYNTANIVWADFTEDPHQTMQTRIWTMQLTGGSGSINISVDNTVINEPQSMQQPGPVQDQFLGSGAASEPRDAALSSRCLW